MCVLHFLLLLSASFAAPTHLHVCLGCLHLDLNAGLLLLHGEKLVGYFLLHMGGCVGARKCGMGEVWGEEGREGGCSACIPTPDQ